MTAALYIINTLNTARIPINFATRYRSKAILQILFITLFNWLFNDDSVNTDCIHHNAGSLITPVAKMSNFILCSTSTIPSYSRDTWGTYQLLFQNTFRCKARPNMRLYIVLRLMTYIFFRLRHPRYEKVAASASLLEIRHRRRRSSG